MGTLSTMGGPADSYLLRRFVAPNRIVAVATIFAAQETFFVGQDASPSSADATDYDYEIRKYAGIKNRPAEGTWLRWNAAFPGFHHSYSRITHHYEMQTTNYRFSLLLHHADT